jgi:hypothetical protein
MPWTAAHPGAVGFDQAAAEELVSRLRLTASRLETAMSVRSSRAAIACEAWRGPRRDEFDAELEALTRQTGALLDEVRAAIVRVLGASDEAEQVLRDRARTASERPA